MIHIAEPSLGEEELNNVIEAVKSGWISSKGDFIEEFEQGFAKYCNRKHGVAVSNGTVALHLALKVLGLGFEHQVIVPDLTFVAVPNSVTYCNARPVFVDSHPDYWCINTEKIAKKITKNTKAIIPVHLYGHSCDMDSILKIAGDYGLYVIEDVAEAHGGEYKGKKLGSFGDISCFSFYGNKIMTTGEGGICLTNNEELAKKMRILRDHGMTPNKRYWHDVIGFNYRLTNMQAAIGVAQLKKLDAFVNKKRQIARWYEKGLKDLAHEGKITLHPEMSWAKNVYWMYSILIEDNFGMSRDYLTKKLEKGIETRPFFYPIHVLPIYKRTRKFPIAEELSRKGINLPSGVGLNKKEVEKVIQEIWK